MNNLLRRNIYAGLLFVAVLAIGATGSAGERSFRLEIANGRLIGTSSPIRVEEGDQVVVKWVSDKGGEVHLHGYDLKLALEAGVEATLRFEAFAAGRFPITLHGDDGSGAHGHDALGYIEVMPR